MSLGGDIEKRIIQDLTWIKGKFSLMRKNLSKEFRKSKVVAGDLRHNAEQALTDLRTGKVFTDDQALENLRNTLGDSLKAAGMTGIFILPGGSVGLIALRKMLKSKPAEKLGIENLLTLTVEESRKIEEEKMQKDDGDKQPKDEEE
ncbi:MAG: hypothetical protein ACK40M_07020 [Flavobacteriales bacterium]